MGLEIYRPLDERTKSIVRPNGIPMYFRHLASLTGHPYDACVAFPRSTFGVWAADLSRRAWRNGRIDHGVVEN